MNRVLKKEVNEIKEIERISITTRTRETRGTIYFKDGTHYNGEYCGGGYTQAQAKQELFENFLSEHKDKSNN